MAQREAAEISDTFPDFDCLWNYDQPAETEKKFREILTAAQGKMKTILSAALVLGICGLAIAQGEKADPVGTWKCEYKIGDMKRTSTLTIKKDGDKLVGTMSWPDQKETKLKDVKLEGGDLTFSAERVVMEIKYAVDYKLTINGDKLKGKGAVEVGVEKREFDIEGKREKSEKA